MMNIALILLAMILGASVAYALWALMEAPDGDDAPAPEGRDPAGPAPPAPELQADLLTIDTKITALRELVSGIARKQEEMVDARNQWENRLLEEMRAILSVQDPEISMAIERIDRGVSQMRETLGLPTEERRPSRLATATGAAALAVSDIEDATDPNETESVERAGYAEDDIPADEPTDAPKDRGDDPTAADLDAGPPDPVDDATGGEDPADPVDGSDDAAEDPEAAIVPGDDAEEEEAFQAESDDLDYLADEATEAPTGQDPGAVDPPEEEQGGFRIGLA